MEGNAMRDTIITNEALYKYKNSAGLRAKNKEAEKQMSLFFSSLTLRSPLLFPTLAKPNKKLKDKEGRRRGRERGSIYKGEYLYNCLMCVTHITRCMDINGYYLYYFLIFIYKFCCSYLYIFSLHVLNLQRKLCMLCMFHTHLILMKFQKVNALQEEQVLHQ